MAVILEGIRAVLFDLDGTLVETDIDFALMKREVLSLGEKYGVPSDELQPLDILAAIDWVAAWLEERSRCSEARRARQEAFEKLEQIELVHCSNAAAIPGAVELLSALRVKGIKIGIVTRNSRSGVRLSLERTGISAEILLARDDVPRTKPHPDHLLRALRVLNVRPEEAVMVGDHWMDVQGGKAAGMRTIGFLRPGRPDDFFDCQNPDLVIRDLGELMSPIERL
jgi:phosphoglycolate phosphatase